MQYLSLIILIPPTFNKILAENVANFYISVSYTDFSIGKIVSSFEKELAKILKDLVYISLILRILRKIILLKLTPPTDVPPPPKLNNNAPKTLAVEPKEIATKHGVSIDVKQVINIYRLKLLRIIFRYSPHCHPLNIVI